MHKKAPCIKRAIYINIYIVRKLIFIFRKQIFKTYKFYKPINLKNLYSCIYI